MNFHSENFVRNTDDSSSTYTWIYRAGHSERALGSSTTRYYSTRVRFVYKLLVGACLAQFKSHWNHRGFPWIALQIKRPRLPVYNFLQACFILPSVGNFSHEWIDPVYGFLATFKSFKSIEWKRLWNKSLELSLFNQAECWAFSSALQHNTD